jgi:hypothetical protein
MLQAVHKLVSRSATAVGHDVISSSGMRRQKFAFILMLISLSFIKLCFQTGSCFEGLSVGGDVVED